MPKFYYTIKARAKSEDEKIGLYGESNWIFPPAHQDFIEAESKKEAKELIESEFGKSFPLRVLKKNIDKEPFLLTIKEVNDKSYEMRLLEKHTCQNCGIEFTILDKYKQNQGRGTIYCSKDCDEKVEYFNNLETAKKLGNMYGSTGIHKACIYRIHNKKNGKSYIGQTTQAFTFRWYQHFFQPSSTKFHQEIQSTPLSDWNFEILEQFDFGIDVKYIIEKTEEDNPFHEVMRDFERDKYQTNTKNLKTINEREQYWINHYDSIENGYNTATACKDEKILNELCENGLFSKEELV